MASFDKSLEPVGALNSELIDSVYQELRMLAAHYLRRERHDHTLQPTALVHEAYLRLAAQDDIVWKNREHLIGIAAIMMRRILVNHAIKRRRDKRGGGDALNVTLDEEHALMKGRSVNLIDLDDALSKMAKGHPIASRVVE